MLRITRLDGPTRTILKVEGQLMGAWVNELAKYRDSNECPEESRLVVDLEGVTFVDEEGQALLEQMWKHGAQLVAVGCLTEAIVAAITKKTEP